MDALQSIMNWYEEQCDGDWEHQYGIKIETLDNPGWTIQIDVADTELEGRGFQKIKAERAEADWIHCKLENNVFSGACGPKNLIELLEIFRKWASAQVEDQD